MISLRRALLVSIATLIATAAGAAGIELPEYERVELPNGTILLLSEKHDVPLIGLRADIRGGAVADPDDRGGLASLFAGLLEYGASDRDAAAFAEAVASVGGELSVSGGLESITISANFVSRDVELMLELVTDMLQRPALTEEEFTKLRDRSVNLIKAAKGSNPGNLLPSYGRAFLFDAHPYGNPIDGSETSLAEITHEEMLSYYEDHVGGDRLIVAVVGDFNAVAMKQRLTAILGNWRAAAIELDATPAPEKRPGRRILLIDKPGATQANFWIGNVGVGIDYERRAELDIANTVFGGRFTSMLNNALRIESGLTYGAWSILQQLAAGGFVAISTFSETETTTEAIDMSLDLLESLRDSGIDNPMITSARNYIMGQFPPRLETASQLASQLARLELFGLDADYVNGYVAALEAAAAEGIADTINEVYPSADDVAFVVIGDAAQLREPLAEYAPVTEMSIDAPRFRVTTADQQ
ncbi:MAG: insulinase family protein [Woeseiaceae bacterium]|nr:insulinase family protein [Woeseiaceae bacterium]